MCLTLELSGARKMDLIPVVDYLGESTVEALMGLLVGMVFGVAAQRSRFCLRAATVEFARGQMGPRMAIWLLTFSTAVVWVQGAQMLGLFRADDARLMAVAGSWSGAVIGGLMFGAGMVLARGCSGRLAGAGGDGQPAVGHCWHGLSRWWRKWRFTAGLRPCAPGWQAYGSRRAGATFT